MSDSVDLSTSDLSDGSLPSRRDALRVLREELQALHQEAGKPSVRKIAQAISVSHDTVHRVLRCVSVPAWEPLREVVIFLSGPIDAFLDHWVACQTAHKEATLRWPGTALSGSSIPDLRGDTWFAALSPAEQSMVQTYGAWREYRPRTTLFHQGQPGTHVMLLTSGVAKLVGTACNGQEALYRFRGPGDLLGAESAIDHAPRPYTAICLTAAEVRVFSGTNFVRMIADHPAISLALMRTFAHDVREGRRAQLDWVSRNSAVRVVALLLELSKRHGVPGPEGIVINLPLTQREIATAAATSREVVARTLRTLRSRDLLRTARQRICLVRPDILTTLVPDYLDPLD